MQDRRGAMEDATRVPARGEGWRSGIENGLGLQ